jgi:hypothetical protein
MHNIHLICHKIYVKYDYNTLKKNTPIIPLTNFNMSLEVRFTR